MDEANELSEQAERQAGGPGEKEADPRRPETGERAPGSSSRGERRPPAAEAPSLDLPPDLEARTVRCPNCGTKSQRLARDIRAIACPGCTVPFAVPIGEPLRPQFADLDPRQARGLTAFVSPSTHKPGVVARFVRWLGLRL